MTGKIDSQLLKGVLTGCILQLLTQEELYGYTLSERLADNGFSDISNGTIYPLLLSMEKKVGLQGKCVNQNPAPNVNIIRSRQTDKQHYDISKTSGSYSGKMLIK